MQADLLISMMPSSRLRSLPVTLGVLLALSIATPTAAIAQMHPGSSQHPSRRTTIIIRPRADQSQPDHPRYPRDWRDPRWQDRPWWPERPRPHRAVSPPSALPPSNTQTCIDLTIMARIAYIWDPESDLSRVVLGAQVANCLGRNDAVSSLGDSARMMQWRNGATARFGDRWYYPNGQPSRFSDAWYYPNGQTLNWGGSWQYPNGRPARFGPYWYTPIGEAVSEQGLITWACSVLPARRCGDRLAAVRYAPRFWYELTLVELAWSAYQRD
ncbi:MAG TPA: hypothetical protein IGS37_09860 [Synechococcales cyanobacterium M55_K2018_004]|nr:hypothetical protein [Synechococcales cyanobacterium M55_K2018_004]